jgi:hypothetical protein
MRQVVCVAAGILMILSAVARADVVELKDGKKLEGTVKQVTPAGVVIDVGGKDTTVERDKIKGIQLGDPPKPKPSAFGEAVEALRAAQDLTSRTPTYDTYMARVTSARFAVEIFAREPEADPKRKAAVAEALGFYTFALEAWQARLKTYGYTSLETNPAVEKCAPLKKELDAATARAAKAADDFKAEVARVEAAKDPKPPPPPMPTPFEPGVHIADKGLPALWACAADRLAGVQ